METKRHLLLLGLCLGVLLTSCHTQKNTLCKNFFKKAVIKKGERLYAYSPSIGIALSRYHVAGRRTKAVIKEDGDALYVSEVEGTLTDSIPVELPERVKETTLSESRAGAAPPRYLFGAREARYEGFTGGLRYRQLKPYVQAMAVAVKFRGPVGGGLPQVESGTTIALAGGLKKSWSKFTGDKNALGFTSRSLSTSFGLLLGGGVVDVGPKTTQNRVLEVNATKNFIIPVGVHGVVGYNNINLGLALGQDIIVGPNRTSWNYFGKWWVGALVGIDIIK